MKKISRSSLILFTLLLFFPISFQSESLVLATAEPEVENGTCQKIFEDGYLPISPPIESGSSTLSIEPTYDPSSGLQTGISQIVSGIATVDFELINCLDK